MRALFGRIPGSVIDVVVYTAIAAVMLVGIFKCLLPMGRLTRLFRKAVAALQMGGQGENGRPVWQESGFLGKPLQKQWKRFLVNAEQLDARGLTCDTEDYINDETALSGYAHMGVAEAVPGLLTSLGILGTFIGLMRGVGGLDVTGADATMASISKMIGGMTFAYGTSIAGLSCSLAFNILSRVQQGRVTGAMDEFHLSFRDLVMKQPLEDEVRRVCYMEDQAAFLKQSAADMNAKLSSGISGAIDSAFTPIGRQMNDFITAQTQGQLEGLNLIVRRFLESMDAALGGQFTYLAQTLNRVSRAETVSVEGVNRALEGAENIMQGMGQMHSLTAQVVEKFDGYVNELAASQSGNAHLAEETSRLMAGLHGAMSGQGEVLREIARQQQALKEQMENYTRWSGQALSAAEKQAGAQAEQGHQIANEMAASGRLLKDSYAGFVQSLTEGFTRTMNLFEENMRALTRSLSEELQKGAASYVALGRLQDTTQRLTEETEKAARALSQGEGR